MPLKVILPHAIAFCSSYIFNVSQDVLENRYTSIQKHLKKNPSNHFRHLTGSTTILAVCSDSLNSKVYAHKTSFFILLLVIKPCISKHFSRVPYHNWVFFFESLLI